MRKDDKSLARYCVCDVDELIFRDEDAYISEK